MGPFFGFGLVPRQYGFSSTEVGGATLVRDGVEGERIRIVGQVFDGADDAITDALIEFWQADSSGVYRHPDDQRFQSRPNDAFSGFGRAGTGSGPDGWYAIETIRPGSIGPGHAPHLNAAVFMRGLLQHVFTRIYFSDHSDANLQDPVLRAVPETRRSTLIAQRFGQDGTYRFDIHMQGVNETVFFAF